MSRAESRQTVCCGAVLKNPSWLPPRPAQGGQREDCVSVVGVTQDQLQARHLAGLLWVMVKGCVRAADLATLGVSWNCRH